MKIKKINSSLHPHLSQLATVIAIEYFHIHAQTQEKELVEALVVDFCAHNYLQWAPRGLFSCNTLLQSPLFVYKSLYVTT